MQMLVLSDDLTGALEVGAKFSQAGASVEVRTRPPDTSPATDVLVIDTETRHKPPQEASRTVRSLVESLSPRLVYKKTDSTLRGNISAELQALADAYPETPVLYCPAYPELGRTVVAGRLYVSGTPVEETPFAQDILNPVTDGNLASLLAPHAKDPVSTIDTSCLSSVCTRGIHVLNGETDDHLVEAARFLAGREGRVLAAGPAGFAGALAKAFHFGAVSPVVRPVPKHSLVVQGSLHERSIAQAKHGELRGWEVLRNLQENRDPMMVALQTGEHVKKLLLDNDFNVVVVFGGDTAYGIIQAMGHPPIYPLEEIVPGVPASVVGNDLILVSKAGGFGPVGVLDRIGDWLREIQ
jgi:uncharacterized protein YgbK (DUF1537 family)